MVEQKVHQALSSAIRAEILKILYKNPQDIEELAKKLKLRPVTVRHHIKFLEDVQLLETHEERSGTAGRPKTYYEIAKSVPIIVYPPRRYMMFSALLIDSLIQSIGKSRVTEILSELGRKMGKETLEELEQGYKVSKWTPKKFEEIFVKECLEAFGTEPEIIERNEKKVVVRVHNCIFYELSKKMPDLMCDIVHTEFFKSIGEAINRGVKVSQTNCMGHGDIHCEHIFEWPITKKGSSTK
jgi:predicted ArsR family transcriptional regulator